MLENLPSGPRLRALGIHWGTMAWFRRLSLCVLGTLVACGSSPTRPEEGASVGGTDAGDGTTGGTDDLPGVGGTAESGGAPESGALSALGGASATGGSPTPAQGGQTSEGGAAGTASGGGPGVGGAPSGGGAAGSDSGGAGGTSEGGAAGSASGARGGSPEGGAAGSDSGGAAGQIDCPPPWTGTGPYFVSPEGRDDGPGTAEAPFRTIQRAADVVAAGDVVTVAGGLYREQVTMRSSGTAPAPIRFQAAPGEAVVVSGADYLDLDWEPYERGIWRAEVERPITQLFVDGRAMVDARWPNTTIDHLVDAPAAKAGFGTTPTALVAPDLPDGDWTGAHVSAVTGWAWLAYVRQISSYDEATRTAVFDRPMRDPDEELPLQLEPGDWYYVFGTLTALDAEGEWFYDAAEGSLYLMPPEGSDPNQLDVEARVRDYAFDLHAEDHVELSGLRIFSAGIEAGKSSGIVVEDVHVRYPVHELIVDGYATPDRATCRLGSNSIWRRGSVSQSSHSGLILLGDDNLVEHSVFSDAGYAFSSTTAGIANWGHTTGNRLSYNTITRTGVYGVRFDGLTSGRISHNDLSAVCLWVPDCGGLYAAHTDGLGAELDHNRVSVSGWRDLANAIYLDDMTEGFVVHHNLVLDYAQAGIMIKGPSHVLSNTVLPAGTVPIAYMPAPPWAEGEENQDLSATLIANNVMPSSPNLTVSLTQQQEGATGYFAATVPAGTTLGRYELPFSAFAQGTCSDPVLPFDLAATAYLTFTGSWPDGDFELWLDDVELIGGDGAEDLMVGDFSDGAWVEALGVDWWGGGGTGAEGTLSFEIDPESGTPAAHLVGAMVPGGWAVISLDLQDFDLSAYTGIRFSAHTSGTLRITAAEGSPILTHNSDCPLDDDHCVVDACGIDQGVEEPPYTDGYAGTAPDLGAFEAGTEPWVAGAATTLPAWSDGPAPGDYRESVAGLIPSYTTELVDDFDDGNLTSPHPLFRGWYSAAGEGSAVAPSPLEPLSGGVSGSAHSLGLLGTRVDYAEVGLEAREGCDLGEAAGLGFFARGSGPLFVSVRMTSLIESGNYNTHGKTISLSDDWAYHTVLFGEPLFGQRYLGADRAEFDASSIHSITFGATSAEVDFAIDEVVLLYLVADECE